MATKEAPNSTDEARRLAGDQRPRFKTREVPKRVRLSLLTPRGRALVATSAFVAAAAIHEFEHRHARSADLIDKNVRIVRLFDLRDDRANLDLISAGLEREWGVFAFVGFGSVMEMASKAGTRVLVAMQLEDGAYTPKAVIQTTLADVHGDPWLLSRDYPSFGDLTGASAWKKAAKGGDTAVLLQIAVVAEDQRGGGLGSLLRNAALNMQDKQVKYALTTTPIDCAEGAASVDLSDQTTFTAAMKFHLRGGAQAALLLPGYKRARDSGGKHSGDVVVMKYERDAAGEWPAVRPPMRLHSSGPIQDRLSVWARELWKLTGRRQARAA